MHSWKVKTRKVTIWRPHTTTTSPKVYRIESMYPSKRETIISYMNQETNCNLQAYDEALRAMSQQKESKDLEL